MKQQNPFLSVSSLFFLFLVILLSEQLVDSGELPDAPSPSVRPQPRRQGTRRLHEVLGLERVGGERVFFFL